MKQHRSPETASAAHFRRGALCAAMLGLAASLAAPALHAATPDLIGHWTLDDKSGKNSAGGAFDAEIKDVRLVPGVFGQAAEFDGRKGSIAIPATLIPEDLSQVTFSAWIAPERYTTVNYRKIKRRLPPVKFNDSGTIFGKDGTPEARFSLSLKEDRFLSFGLSVGRNYAECDALVPKSELCDGKWHHVAATFDGATMRVYLDGALVGKRDRQGKLGTFHDFAQNADVYGGPINRHGEPEKVPACGKPLSIGARLPFDEKDPGAPRFLFAGKIDDMRFYRTALDKAQIASLVNAAPAAARPTPPPVPAAPRNLPDDLGDALEELSTHEISGATQALALHRSLLARHSEALNAYMERWKQSPVDRLLRATPAKRLELARALAKDPNCSPFEYLPLTDLQWSVLSKSERAKWIRAKELQARLGDDKAGISASDLYFLESLSNPRPLNGENVAWAGDNAKTPETRTRSADEARNLIEQEWLYQVNGKPTADEARKQLGHARRLLARLKLPAPRTSAFTTRLDALQKRVDSLAATPRELYLEVRALKREITFQNPAIDFDTLLYIDNPTPVGSEWNHETRHRLGYLSQSKGGRLIIQKGLGPDGILTQLAPQAPLGGTFWRPDVSYDGRRVLFSFKPHNEKAYHIYEINVDGTGLRQLTSGPFDDLDPIYLPDQKNILFTTTRGHLYVRCMPSTAAPVMARLPLDSKPGDKSLLITSRNGEPEYLPTVLEDGRVIYTRWEYTDKPLWRAQSLWTMNQDTSNVQVFWGNQSVWPDVLKDARQIPGTQRILLTATGHHDWFAGSLAIVDPTKGLNYPHGLTQVTPELDWPEVGRGPEDTPELPKGDYQPAPYRAYYSPYPISERDFLVSARKDNDKRGNTVLLLMDLEGNRELIASGTHSIRYAQPLRARPRPKTQPDTVDWPTWETREKPGTGLIYSNNVYENAPPELKDKAKYLRIWSIEHKTYTYWIRRPYASSGPELSPLQAEGVKKIIGTVPIEADGSVAFNAPSGIALHFQLLDKDHRALQTMKSFTGVQPGETRACFGCHEQKM
ncbi:MAG: hypothetical protein LBG65_07240, partial [Puniceicoccales bacterium]|nr:hypothetical protein [Puniceicoccales bacterium]